MIRKLFAICFGVSLLGACGRAPAPEPEAPRAGPTSSSIVEEVRNYANPRNIPARFRHLIDWHAGTDAVVLLLAEGGRRGCVIDPDDASDVIIGQSYRCRWSSAR